MNTKFTEASDSLKNVVTKIIELNELVPDNLKCKQANDFLVEKTGIIIFRGSEYGEKFFFSDDFLASREISKDDYLNGFETLKSYHFNKELHLDGINKLNDTMRELQAFNQEKPPHESNGTEVTDVGYISRGKDVPPPSRG